MIYEIKVSGRLIYSGDSESSFLDKLEELAEEYYNTGEPSPENIETIIQHFITMFLESTTFKHFGNIMNICVHKW